MLIKDILNELGNRPLAMPNKWSSDYDEYYKNISLPDGKNLRIAFNLSYNNYALLNFYVDQSQQMTGTGDAILILSTVVDQLRDFVRKRRPNVIAWTANDNDLSRIRVYDKMMPRIIQLPEFKNYLDITNDESMWPDDLTGTLDDFQDVSSGKLYVLGKKSFIRMIK